MELKFAVPEGLNSKIIFERHVKAFLDLLVLALLEDRPQCGYDILAIIHKRFNVLLSPGTLYPLLYALEKQGFVEGQTRNRRKNYTLSKRGSIILKDLSGEFENSSHSLLSVMKHILEVKKESLHQNMVEGLEDLEIRRENRSRAE